MNIAYIRGTLWYYITLNFAQMAHFLDKVFGDPNKKYIKKIQPLVDQINALEPTLKGFSDEKLKEQTAKLKKELSDNNKSLDDILPEAYATVREAARRVLGMRHYDVQLIGGIAMHQGRISEMKTGEGKTLVATLPLYLNALAGKGVHLVTVNDYLSSRDCGWMAPVYHFLGLNVGVIVHQTAYLFDPEYIDENHHDERLQHLKAVERKEAYQADITYGTNNEFGFDYLRDNMVQSVDQKVQRDFFYAIVDEVDSILIDEARTPLIISAPDMESTERYRQFAQLVVKLKENEDYNVDEKMRSAILTEEGITKMEKMLGVDNIYTERGVADVHHIEQALRAHAIFKKDKDYVVKDNEIIIVDEFTGRMMPGRRYGEGLHQAIEAKENVEVQRESKTLATITFQNYFRMYEKLAGMTGTAETEAEEFEKIYNLLVTVVPTNKEIERKDLSDRIFKSERGKLMAVVAEVKKRHETGQPILIGTISIEKNEVVAELLRKEGLDVKVLNAKAHEREAEIISQAGKPGAITVATNMAGRGVDIKLGGDPVDKEIEKKVKELGGLCIIGTERHESRRIDNQLRGRAGRQGDPGVSQFYVSFDDDLMRIFPSERMKTIMERMNVPEDMAIETKIITRTLESAQKKVEGYHFDSRKHLVQYDDVINKHRETVYGMRWDILTSENAKDHIITFLQDEIDSVVSFHTKDDDEHIWDIEEIYEVAHSMFPVPAEMRLKLDQIREQAGDDIEDDSARAMLKGYLLKLATESYNQLEDELATALGNPDALRKIEKAMLLRSIDVLWVEHLEAINHLRTGIGLRGYGQRDPLVEYKKEAFHLFHELLATIRKRVVYGVFKVSPGTQISEQSSPMRNMMFQAPAKTAQSNQSSLARMAQQAGGKTDQQKQVEQREQVVTENERTHYQGQKVGRNDLCPCGSGKKFKQCHGK